MSGVNCHMLIGNSSQTHMDNETRVIWKKEQIWALPIMNILVTSCKPNGQMCQFTTILGFAALDFLMDHK